MLKRITVLAALLTLLAAVAVLFLRGWMDEPVFEGERLGHWLRVLHNPNAPAASQQAARHALHSMGTNLIPILVASAGKPEASTLSGLVRVANQLGLSYQLPGHLARSTHGLLRYSIEHLDEETRRQAARALFMEYAALERKGAGDESRWMELAALFFRTGNAAHELLAASLTNSTARLRARAASLVGFYSDMPLHYLSALEPLLDDPDPDVRFHATSSLARFDKQAERVVPLVARALSDPNDGVRFNAAWSLMRFGPRAKEHIPELITMGVRDVHFRPHILSWIHEVDPEMAPVAEERFQAVSTRAR